MNFDGSAWNKLVPEYELPESEVHVWRYGVDVAPTVFGKLRQILSPEEREQIKQTAREYGLSVQE